MKYLCLLFPLALPTAAIAEAPNLKTPSPVLYLADNLDEPEKLGYCLDTVGRGQSDRAHLHSCKPQGGDVQFQYDEATQRIQSATFTGICLDVTDQAFALLECSDAESQKFSLIAETGEIRLASDTDLCLSSSPDSRQAGPFVARDLTISECDAIPDALKTWVQN